MSFAKIESEIIRDADRDNTFLYIGAASIKDWIASQAMDLAEGGLFPDEQLIGSIGRDLILLCAKLDLDLTTCIRKAVEK